MTRRTELKRLARAYLDPRSPGFRGGKNRLLHAVKGSKREDVDAFLSKQIDYIRHAPVARRRYTKIFAPHPSFLFEADLADMSALKKANDGVTFLLGVLDAFTRKAWVVPLRNKSAQTVTDAMRRILDASGNPRHLRTDAGKEFLNRHFQSLMKERSINHYTATRLPFKCAIVERFWRTLKSRLARHMTGTNTRRFVAILDDVVAGYNSTPHRSIGMAPNVADQHVDKVYRKLYGREVTSTPRFNAGDRVHLLKNRNNFRQGYKPLFTSEVHEIESVASRHGPTRYRIANRKGSFYDWELRSAI